jgi:hypothetical protein
MFRVQTTVKDPETRRRAYRNTAREALKDIPMAELGITVSDRDLDMMGDVTIAYCDRLVSEFQRSWEMLDGMIHPLLSAVGQASMLRLASAQLERLRSGMAQSVVAEQMMSLEDIKRDMKAAGASDSDIAELLDLLRELDSAFLNKGR